jgi:hypothetical protein
VGKGQQALIKCSVAPSSVLQKLRGQRKIGFHQRSSLKSATTSRMEDGLTLSELKIEDDGEVRI